MESNQIGFADVSFHHSGDATDDRQFQVKIRVIRLLVSINATGEVFIVNVGLELEEVTEKYRTNKEFVSIGLLERSHQIKIIPIHKSTQST